MHSRMHPRMHSRMGDGAGVPSRAGPTRPRAAQVDVDALSEATAAVDEFHGALASYAFLRGDAEAAQPSPIAGPPPPLLLTLSGGARGAGAVAGGAVALRQLEFVRAYPELAALAEGIAGMRVPWDAVGGGGGGDARPVYLDLPRECAARLRTLARCARAAAAARVGNTHSPPPPHTHTPLCDCLHIRMRTRARVHLVERACGSAGTTRWWTRLVRATRRSRGCTRPRPRRKPSRRRSARAPRRTPRAWAGECASATPRDRRAHTMPPPPVRRTLDRACAALEDLALECELCCTPLSRGTVNEACAFAPHAAAVGARAGGGPGDRSARHYFVAARRRGGAEGADRQHAAVAAAAAASACAHVPRPPLGTLRL